MFGMEAARLFVTVGVDGMTQLVSDMHRGEAAVDKFGNSKATAIVGQSGADAVVSKMSEVQSKVEQVGRAKAEPSVRVAGVDAAISKLDQLKAKLMSTAQGGGLGSFAQDISLGRGLSGSLRGAGGAISSGFATGGVGGGLSALGGVVPLPILAGIGAAAGIGAFSLGKAGEQERFQTQLSVLLGGMDEAKKRMAELVEFAATTPFELPEVINASKTLQVFTGDVLSSGAALRLIGDVAAGTGSNFGETAMWFGRMYDAMKSGRPFGEATMRLQEMGAMGGKSREKIESLAEAVKSGSMTMDQAWALASQEFGRFSGMMEKQSMTMEGKLSNLQDAIGQSAAKFGTVLLPAAKITLDFFIMLFTALGGLIDFVVKLGGAVVDLAGDFVDWVSSMPAVKDFMTFLGQAAEFVGDAWDKAADIIGDGVDSARSKLDDLSGHSARLAAEVAQHAEMTGSAWFQAFRAGERDISEPVKAIANVLPQRLDAARLRAIEIAKQSVVDIANALRDNRTEWQKAVDGLKYDMEHSMTTAAEIAAVKGELAAVNAAKGWTSGDPVLIAALASTKQILENRLDQLAPAAGKKGRDAMDALGKILKSDPTPANAARLQVDKVEKVFLGMPGYEWGAALIEQWLKGMRSKAGAVRHTAWMLTEKVAALTRLASPAKEGPLSEGGGPEGWGERGAFLYGRGWSKVGNEIERSLRGISMPDNSHAAFGRSGGAGYHGGDERANAIPGGGVRIDHVHVDARGATDPEATRRAAKRGVMDAVAEGLRQQDARLPKAASS